MLKHFVLGICMTMLTTALSHTGKISGTVKADGEPVEFASVSIESLKLGVSTNKQGKYSLSNIPEGDYQLIISFIGYEKLHKAITISHNNLNVNLNIDLHEKSLLLDEVVVTGSKTFKRKTESPQPPSAPKPSKTESDSDTDYETDNEDWIDVDEAKTVDDAMKAIWLTNPETFYLYGDKIKQMVTYKLKMGWTRE